MNHLLKQIQLFSKTYIIKMKIKILEGKEIVYND